MKPQNELIYPQSVWHTAVPSSETSFLPLIGLEAGHFYAEPRYRVIRQYHNSLLLLYTIQGCGKIQYQNEEFLLSENQAMIIDCTTPHEYYPAGDSWEFLWLHFQGSHAVGIYRFLYPEGPKAVSIRSDGFVPAFESILDELLQFDALHRYGLSCHIQELLLMVGESLNHAETTVEGRDKLVKQAVRYMEEHYGEFFTIEELASRFNLSQFHFIRIFRRITGVTPYSYLLSCRISKAKRFLVDTDLSVEEIASRCGFADGSNFISHFKKLTGDTPLKYRKAFR